ncbi:hypothetical protein [Methylobacterium sp.]|uniref:hypothetical protein n=1 Tax=Methylobacterium sp. TaxID=409 RepID=UPI00257C1154|nr:hypothetical protein [Methylobacterium sp.]
MAANKLLTFASADGNNAAQDAAWASSAVRLLGWQNGIVDGPTFSKMGRQGAFGSAILGQAIADYARVDAVDDGDVPNALANLRIALAAMLAGVAFGQDTSSTANVLTISLDPQPPTLVGFRELFVRVNNSNTGPVTIALAGLGSKNATRHDGSPLQGGDLPAGQIAHFLYDPTLAQWILSGFALGEIQRVVTSPTLYIRSDGNDATADGSSNTATSAFATITAAYSYGVNRFALATNTLTLQLGTPGVYAAPNPFSGAAGRIRIRGDSASPASYIVQGPGPATGSSGIVGAQGGMVLDLAGLTISNTGTNNHTVVSALNGSVSVANCILQTAGGNVAFSHFATSAGGSISINSGNTVASSMGSLLSVSGGSIVLGQNVLAIINSPTFAVATCLCEAAGYVIAQAGSSISGSATGQRYLARLNGIINVLGAGQNFFPGTTAGTVASGGQYAA